MVSFKDPSIDFTIFDKKREKKEVSIELALAEDSEWFGIQQAVQNALPTILQLC